MTKPNGKRREEALMQFTQEEIVQLKEYCQAVKERREIIKNKVVNALHAQFATYSWTQMIEDTLGIGNNFTKTDIEWAKKHLDFQLVELP